MLQLSSNTFRAFHGAAVIRDGGVPGKDLGPMPLGYTLSFGLPWGEGVSDAEGGWPHVWEDSHRRRLTSIKAPVVDWGVAVTFVPL